ncbi:PilZ domain-containing protein [Methyloprofundus sp.]|uniref:PilZ domain-containing protein n=1 Tax=Methyloprofundus sp. TaxID=2020875 RepID=UPI003D135DF3
MTPNKDLQQFQLIFDQACPLLSYDDGEYSCELIDISLQGCLLGFKNTWEQHDLESLYTLTLELPETTPIVMNLSISHVVDNEVGFKCEHMDLDDISALSHFVELNQANITLLDRELIALMHCG